MSSGESHFKLSLIVRDKVTRQCPQTTTFEEKGEPKRNRAEALLLTSLTPSRWAKPAHEFDMNYGLNTNSLRYSACVQGEKSLDFDVELITLQT